MARANEITWLQLKKGSTCHFPLNVVWVPKKEFVNCLTKKNVVLCGQKKDSKYPVQALECLKKSLMQWARQTWSRQIMNLYIFQIVTNTEVDFIRNSCEENEKT